MEHCVACGMPLMKPEDFGAKLDVGNACAYCSNEDGSIKSCDEIFEGGVQFFMSAVDGAERDLAERLVRKNMNRLPYWQGKSDPSLEGEEATDEEFAEAMKSM